MPPKGKFIKSKKTGRIGLTYDDGATVEVLPENTKFIQSKKTGRWAITNDGGNTVEVLDNFDGSSIEQSYIEKKNSGQPSGDGSGRGPSPLPAESNAIPGSGRGPSPLPAKSNAIPVLGKDIAAGKPGPAQQPVNEPAKKPYSPVSEHFKNKERYKEEVPAQVQEPVEEVDTYTAIANNESITKKQKASTLVQLAKVMGVPVGDGNVDDPNTVLKLITSIDNGNNFTPESLKQPIDWSIGVRAPATGKPIVPVLNKAAKSAKGILQDYYIELLGQGWMEEPQLDTNGKTVFKIVKKPEFMQGVPPTKEFKKAYLEEKYYETGLLASKVMPDLKIAGELASFGASGPRQRLMQTGAEISKLHDSNAIINAMKENGISMDYLDQQKVINGKVDELQRSGLKINEMIASAGKNGGKVGPEYAEELEAYNKYIAPIVQNYKNQKPVFDAEVAPLLEKLKEND